MLLELRLRGIFAELLCECPLVLRAVASEERRSDPRLKNEPATGIYTADLLVGVIKRWGADLSVEVMLALCLATQPGAVRTYKGEAALKANRLTAADKYCATMLCDMGGYVTLKISACSSSKKCR
jgi:hypothetical protein